MPQSILQAAQNLATALAADTELAAWCAAHFGATHGASATSRAENTTLSVLKGRAAGPILSGSVLLEPQQLPAVLLENATPITAGADSTSKTQAIGGKRSEESAEIALAFVFLESDAEASFIARLELLDIVTRFGMRNRTLGGAAGAFQIDSKKWVEIPEPTYVLMVSTTVDYQVTVA